MEFVFRDDAYARSCTARVIAADARGVRLDRTVFYAAGGGQPGDNGCLLLGGDEALAVTDAAYDPDSGEVLHRLAPGVPAPPPGTDLTAEIDWERRFRHMRMHTALHLLCAVVAGGVTGGAIGDGRGRLDFDLPNSRLDKEAIEAEINRLIAADKGVSVRWIDEAELDANPALVRTLSVQPPRGSGRIRLVEIDGVDLQPCGGTHVRRTGEIGRIAVAKIENKGRHNRRINLALAE